MKIVPLIGLALLAGGSAYAARPNLIILESDDHHYQALGCMGDPVRTPHIDRLAQRGVLFRNNLAQGTACAPSRNALLTGAYPHNTGVYDNRDGNMAAGIWTFPQALQKAGYRTALVGKNHFKPHSEAASVRERTAEGQRRELESLGFEYIHAITGKVAAASGRYVPGQDAYRDYLQQKGVLDKLRADYEKRDRSTGIEPSVLGVEDYQDTYIASRAIDFIRGHDRDRPFFLWVDFVAPHPPADAPLPYATMYDPAQVRRKIPPPEGRVLRGRQKITEEEARRFRAAYYGMITLLDEQVGRIVAALEQTGRLENTVIVFAGDQGSMLGDHGQWGKGVFYKGSINSPLVIAGPGVRGGQVVDRPVELIGVAPTLLELAGAPAEAVARCQGESLLPLLSGRGEYRRTYAFAEEFKAKMIADDRHKLIADPEEPMLFDLQADPEERKNLHGKLPDVQMRLQRELKGVLARTGPVKPPNPTPRSGAGKAKK